MLRMLGAARAVVVLVLYFLLLGQILQMDFANSFLTSHTRICLLSRCLGLFLFLVFDSIPMAFSLAS